MSDLSSLAETLDRQSQELTVLAVHKHKNDVISTTSCSLQPPYNKNSFHSPSNNVLDMFMRFHVVRQPVTQQLGLKDDFNRLTLVVKLFPLVLLSLVVELATVVVLLKVVVLSCVVAL